MSEDKFTVIKKLFNLPPALLDYATFEKVVKYGTSSVESESTTISLSSLRGFIFNESLGVDKKILSNPFILTIGLDFRKKPTNQITVTENDITNFAKGPITKDNFDIIKKAFETIVDLPLAQSGFTVELIQTIDGLNQIKMTANKGYLFNYNSDTMISEPFKALGVMEITPLGNIDTVDIKVEDLNSFTADGLINENNFKVIQKLFVLQPGFT
jgi:hypothetical protein